MSLINTWDTNLFLLINGYHDNILDIIMITFSDKIVWIPLYLNVLYILIVLWRKNSIWPILSIILCIVIADQVSSGILKELVQRLRPSHEPSLQGLVHIVNGYVGGKYGFVSSHAANAIGFALLSSLIFKELRYTIGVFLWALITAYSRIYLGVHYPLDVIGGAMVGIMAALFCYWLLMKFKGELFANAGVEIRKKTYSISFNLLVIILLTVMVVALYKILLFTPHY